MTKEEFVKQRCEIDKITEEEFEKTYRVVDCNCGAPYCKGYRCLDLDGLLKENQSLKKQLEEWNHHLKCAKEMLDLQGQSGNYNYDSYMLGLYNGMEYIISLFETREPIYKEGKDIEFLRDKNQQKEFIKWLENYLELFNYDNIDEQGYYDMFEEILQKYKEIIGDDK